MNGEVELADELEITAMMADKNIRIIFLFRSYLLVQVFYFRAIFGGVEM